MIDPYIENITDSLDAAVFGGDAFRNAEHRAHLREMIRRWTAELDALDLEIDCTVGHTPLPNTN